MGSQEDRSPEAMKETRSLFEDAEEQAGGGRGSLFDEQFESKVSAWRSYKEEKADGSTLGGASGRQTDSTAQEREAPAPVTAKERIHKFWAADEMDMCAKADAAQDGGSVLSAMDDLMAIDPKVLGKIMFEGSLTKKLKCEGAKHPSISNDLKLEEAYRSKRACAEDRSDMQGSNAERSINEIPTLEEFTRERSTVEEFSRERPIKEIPTLEEFTRERSNKDSPNIGEFSRERPIKEIPTLEEFTRERSTREIPTVEEFSRERPSLEEFSKEMSSKADAASTAKEARDTFNMTQEVIQNLETKVATLHSQIENLKQAVAWRDSRIREMEMQLECSKENTENVDHKCVETYIKQALGILERMKSQDVPRDQSVEIECLRLENMNLKSLVEELTMRLQQKKAAGR